MSSAAIRAGAAYVELLLRDSQYVRGLAKAKRQMQSFGASADAVGRNLVKSSALIATPFAVATKIFSSFTDQMAIVRAVTGATEEKFAALTQRAKELGRTTSFTASQVAEGMTAMGRAGFDADQILAAIPHTLDLARSTATDLGEATDIAAAAMRGFNLGADDMQRVVDVLSGTANGSAQTLVDLGESMKYVAPLAYEAGAQIEDVANMLAVMANNGIKGSMGGTSLARAYKNLAQEAKRTELANLGIQVADAAGNMRPLASIMQELARATASMGSADRLAVFESLFGRGSAAALKLASPTADLAKGLGDLEGYAGRAAKQMDQTLGGTFRMLMSAAEGVAIALAEAVAPTIADVAQGATKLAGLITAFIGRNRELFDTVLKVAAGLAVAGSALIALGLSVKLVAFGLGGLLTVLSAVGTALGLIGAIFAALVSPVGIITASVAALGGYLVYSSETGSKALQFLGKTFGELKGIAVEAWGAIGKALAAGDIDAASKVLWASLRLAWLKGTMDLREHWFALRDAMVNTWTGGQNSIAKGILSGIAAIKIGWDGLVTFLANTWTNFIATMQIGWIKAAAGAEIAALKVKGLVTDTDVAQEIAAIQADTAAERVRTEARIKTGNRNKAHADYAKGVRGETADALGILDKDQRAAADARAKASADAMTEAQRALRDAQKEYADAIAGADAPGAAGGEGPGAPPKFAPPEIGKIAGVAGAAMAGAAGRLKGTFSGYAAGRMGGPGAWAERTAKAAENIDRKQAEILAEIRQNGAGIVLG